MKSTWGTAPDTGRTGQTPLLIAFILIFRSRQKAAWLVFVSLHAIWIPFYGAFLSPWIFTNGIVGGMLISSADRKTISAELGSAVLRFFIEHELQPWNPDFKISELIVKFNRNVSNWKHLSFMKAILLSNCLNSFVAGTKKTLKFPRMITSYAIMICNLKLINKYQKGIIHVQSTKLHNVQMTAINWIITFLLTLLLSRQSFHEEMLPRKVWKKSFPFIF